MRDEDNGARRLPSVHAHQRPRQWHSILRQSVLLRDPKSRRGPLQVHLKQWCYLLLLLTLAPMPVKSEGLQGIISSNPGSAADRTDWQSIEVIWPPAEHVFNAGEDQKSCTVALNGLNAAAAENSVFSIEILDEGSNRRQGGAGGYISEKAEQQDDGSRILTVHFDGTTRK